MTMPTKREKRQREYNHNFVSHQYTSFSFHSFVSILSKHRTCSLHKRQNLALSVHYFLLPPFVLIFFLSFLFFLLYRDTKGEKISHGCFFFTLLISIISSPVLILVLVLRFSLPIFFPLSFSFVSLETLR